jgi:hypothetical protein
MAKPSVPDERHAAPPAPPGPAVKGDAAREQRLAAALRANLRRRKAGTAAAKLANGEGTP